MESALATVTGARRHGALQVDAQTLWIWALTGGLVLCLAFNGGGYDLVVRSQVAVVVWWTVLVAAVAGVLPAARLSRAGWAALWLLGAFAAWTALATTWSLSTERSLQEVSRLAAYLGVLVVAVVSYGDRRSALRHTVAALATAVAFVCALAVLSRLAPQLFPGAQTTGSYLPGAHGRLGWPLNYWNALAALAALGIPLLASIATSARALLAQALAAATIPPLVLCGYLTFSRGGAIAAAAGLIMFVALAPDRIPKLATLLLSAGGGAALIAGAVHRHAIELGLTDASARHQGSTLLVAVVLVCTGVGLAQAGIGLLARHATRPGWLEISRRRASVGMGVAVVAAVGLALALGASARLSHLWRDFKRPNASNLHQNAIGRFGATSGNGRYEYWKVAIQASQGHVLTGSGPGTFQLLYLPRAQTLSYVVDAHSLYVETYAEVGLVGLALLLGFLVTVLGTAVRSVSGADAHGRTAAAAAAAAVSAFLVSAAFDWVWQMPVLPVAVLLLAAAVLAPSRRRVPAPSSRMAGIAARVALAGVAAASLIAIGVPLATTEAVRQSQAAVNASDTTAALSDARSAVALEPGAATPQLQEALVLELRGDLPDAVTAARRATADEPANWQTWLVLSRLEAESGHATAAIAAYRRARTQNPRSLVFHQ